MRIIVISACLLVAGIVAGVLLGLRHPAAPAPPGAPAGPVPTIERVWRFRAGASVTTAAAVAGPHAFFGCDDGRVYCIRVADGNEVWSFKAPDGIAGMPLVFEGKVYVGSRDYNLYCLDQGTGRLLWTFVTGGQVVGGAAAVPAAAGIASRVVFGSYDYNLYCLDANSGSEIWKYPTGYYVNSRPIIVAGRAIFGGCDMLLHVVNLADGNGLPPIPLAGEVASEVGVDGPLVYVGHYRNEMMCIDLDKMSVLWRSPAGPVLTGAALDGASRVIFGSQDNFVHCLDRFGGGELWHYDAGAWVDSTLSIDDGRVFGVTNGGDVFVLSLDSGALQASGRLPGDSRAPVTISGELILVPCDDGYLYCLKRPRPGGAL